MGSHDCNAVWEFGRDGRPEANPAREGFKWKKRHFSLFRHSDFDVYPRFVCPDYLDKCTTRETIRGRGSPIEWGYGHDTRTATDRQSHDVKRFSRLYRGDDARFANWYSARKYGRDRTE
jgi:hypothetical protein